MQRFDCARCGALISFEDSGCPACGDRLAYRPDLLSMVNASTDDGALLQGWHACAESPGAATGSSTTGTRTPGAGRAG
ncbi:MAG TPA: zinc-ribbon domain-containing protein [Microlunatus sp.]|nr:zinc-ribbon domain-containing protein [Microlunatus sp.]